MKTWFLRITLPLAAIFNVCLGVASLSNDTVMAVMCAGAAAIWAALTAVMW